MHTLTDKSLHEIPVSPREERVHALKESLERGELDADDLVADRPVPDRLLHALGVLDQLVRVDDDAPEAT